MGKTYNLKVRAIKPCDDNYNPCTNAEHLYLMTVEKIGLYKLTGFKTRKGMAKYIKSILGDPDFEDKDFETVSDWIYKDLRR